MSHAHIIRPRAIGGESTRTHIFLLFCTRETPYMRQPSFRNRLNASLLAGCVAVFGACESGSLTWEEADGYRWAELREPGADGVGFTQLMSSQTGISFSNIVTEEQYISNSHFVNGSGVALGDVDGDGLVDIYFSSMDGPNELYQNLGGWKFEEIAAASGVDANGRFSTGATFADVDGDGDLDLLVTALGGPNALFLNDGTGSFSDVTDQAGLSSTLGSMSMALADVDGDGDLDLYVANNKVATVEDLYPPDVLQPSNIYRLVDGRAEVRPEFQEHYAVGEVVDGRVARLEIAEPDRFYLNDGTGRFTAVPFTGGAFLDEQGQPLREDPREWALSVRFHDMDGDGDPDLYVCNDFHSPDHVWINDGSGRFRAPSFETMRNTSFATMGIDFSDVDRDGDTDFFLVEMLSRNHQRRMKQVGGGLPDPPFVGQIANRPQKPRNTLFVNRGDGTYAEAAQYAGIDASEWSWGSLYVDVDFDGYEDLLIGNGHFYDAIDKDAARRPETADWRRRITVFPPLRLKNIAFRNRGDLTFEEVGEAWGFANDEDISHGLASADLDNDGDLDVVINRLMSPAGVFRNEAGGSRVAVRLRGDAPNTGGVGAKIRLMGGPVPVQIKEVTAGGHYLSSSDALASFAAGDGEMSLEVTWRDGGVSRVIGVQANRIYEVSESGAVAATPAAATHVEPVFTDVSQLINHVHVENAFDDFVRQPLVPIRFSQSGPGVSWFDSDADGDDDLFLTSGTGGSLAQFRNDGDRGFRAVNEPALSRRSPYDQTMALGLTDDSGSPLLVVGESTYEADSYELPAGTVYEFNGGSARRREAIPGDLSSAGALASADYDGDGDLDLFVAGRLIPIQYPALATSRLFLNEGGRFVLDEGNADALADIGLVSGATFSDIDGDGDADLVLAIEWGPVRVFINRDGRLRDMTVDLGLGDFTGWWNGVTTGDLDGDGRLDIIATNRGLNGPFKASGEYPATIHHADFDNNGTWDVVETRHDAELGAAVPLRGLLTLGNALPLLQRRVQGFEQYGGMSVEDLIGGPIRNARVARAKTLAHMAFMNRGDSFEAVLLPREAQLAPAFAVTVADFDGDGAEDVFLSQNLFAVRSEANREDAGRGLWLRGDGAGGLDPVPGSVSGIKVYGEGRGAAVSDFDADGRVDLVVAQNGGETKLYRNTGAAPGLRVRLQGPRENPAGIGSVVRLRYADRLGPAREIHAGSGYWSQDSAVPVLGKAGQVVGVSVRWPGGEQTETAVPADALEVTINASGDLVDSRG